MKVMGGFKFLGWFEGRLYYQNFRGWSEITGICKDTIYCRYKKYKVGKLDRKYLLHVGTIPYHKVPPKRKVKIEINFAWLYAKERKLTATLKRLELDLP